VAFSRESYRDGCRPRSEPPHEPKTVIEILIPGPRGLAAPEKPFEQDPVEVYLQARGAKPNDNSDE